MGGRPSRDYGSFGYDLVWLLGYVWEHVRFLFKAENWRILSYLVRDVVNWQWVLLWRLGFKRPFQVKVEGDVYQVRDDGEYLALIEHLKLSAHGIHYTLSEDRYLVFQVGGREFVLEFGPIPRHQALGLIEKFYGLQRWFSVLDVKDRVVVDIGANIGDTPIYFYLRGASRVVAFEPDTTYYGLAVKNIARNVPEDRVVVLNEAVGKPGIIRVDTSPPPSIGHPLRVVEGGKEVRVRSLDEVVKEYSIGDGVLKVVCVGCEVDLFNYSTDDSLKAFNQIMVFAMYGSKWLTTRLKECGFKVRILERHYVHLIPTKDRLIINIIYATK